MLAKNAVLANRAGLFARPATFFIQKANEFNSQIWIERGKQRINAKSLLGVLSLGIAHGTEITIIAEGEDEVEAVEGLLALIETKFGEDV